MLFSETIFGENELMGPVCHASPFGRAAPQVQLVRAESIASQRGKNSCVVKAYKHTAGQD